MVLYRVSAKAQLDIEEISDFIMRDNPVRALSFTRELREKIAAAAQAPLVYRERVELKPGVRAARHGRYLIFFRLDGHAIEVLRVWHAARDQIDLFEN